MFEEVLIEEINTYLTFRAINVYRFTGGKSVFSTAGCEYTRYQLEALSDTKSGVIDIIIKIIDSDDASMKIPGKKITISAEQVVNNEFYNSQRAVVDNDIQELEIFINSKK